MQHLESADILREFLVESREFVESLHTHTLALEKSLEHGQLDVQETIHAIFRGFHSTKGSANYLQFNHLASLAHEAESLLDRLRKNTLPLRAEHVEVLFLCGFQLEKLLDEVEHDSGAPDLQPETESLIRRLQSLSREKTSPQILDRASHPELELARLTRSLLERLQSRQHGPAPEPELAGLIETLTQLGFEDWALAFRKIAFLGKQLARLNQTFPPALHRLTLEQLQTLADHLSSGKPPPAISAATHQGLEELLAKPNYAPGSPPMLGETLLDLGVIQEQQLTAALEIQSSPLGSILRQMNSVKESELNLALQIQKQAASSAKDHTAAFKPSSIRVNVEKLDQLYNLVEELTLAESLLAHDWQHAAGQTENEPPSARMLSRISRDLQHMARQLRMVPMDATLQKLSRMARDLASKLNKKIKVDIHGGETEIDKNIVEMLGNPLAHMVRNALDHGLEPPDIRQATGKHETGTLTLTACHEGSNIVVRIADDGRGLNSAKILAKARERNLLGALQPRTPEEIFELIWLPGFSTATTVTELSGRGVGMDVVRKEIEALHGQVQISSQPGKGTTFTLTIPLSLSMIDGMLVRAGDHVFTVPLLDTRQTLGSHNLPVCFPPGDLPRVSIQGRLLPIFSLHHFFSSTHSYRKDPVYVVVEAGHTACCLSADEVVGMRRTVIQSVPKYLGTPRAVSGFSILGDGSITYVIDTLKLGKLITSSDEHNNQIGTISLPKNQ